jgi:hypothetical protein
MQYIFQLFNDEKYFDTVGAEEAGRVHGAYTAYTNALREAGVYVDGNPLAPTSTATTVRVTKDGKTTVLDGPFADTKEQLAGYYVVDVPDLDSAISWAARCPCASYGTVEVRPIMAVPAEV